MLSVIVVACCLFAMIYSEHTDGYIFIDEYVNWVEANLKCMQYNATLATISDLVQHKEALDLCESERCWIGLSNIFGSYAFMDQSIWIYHMTFCDTSSILSCASISNMNNNNECYWNHNDCKDIKMPVLCNMPSHIVSTSTHTPKCNYFVDSTTFLPHPIDICSVDSQGINTVYKCDNDSNNLNVYTIAEMEDDGRDCNAFIDSNISTSYPLSHNNAQCTSSICTENDIVSVIQYDFASDNKRCSQDMFMNEEYNNNMDWIQMDLVIDLCLPSQEYDNLYTHLICSSTKVTESYYNDSDCTHFQFSETLFSHNTCSNDGKTGYHIQECGAFMQRNAASYVYVPDTTLDEYEYEYGYINDGRISTPINKCQSIYSYSMSYKYICIQSKQHIINRIFYDNTDCNGFHYFDVELSLDHLVDFNCNNRISANIININYYQDVVDHTPSIVYTQSIIVNQCFPMNSTFSFQYKCSDNTTLHRLIYANDIECDGEAVIDADGLSDNEDSPWIGIAKCNTNDSIIMNIPPLWTDLADPHKKAKIFMFVLLALFVATCLMFAVFGVLVWNYFKTQTGKTKSKSKLRKYKFSTEIDNSTTATNNTTKRKYTSTEPKSVISYDVEDNGDLPGVDLWKARKRSSYSSPPVSEHTATLPTLPNTPMVLLPVDSADTITSHFTTSKGMDVSTIMDGIESLRKFSGEYYESPRELEESSVYVD